MAGPDAIEVEGAVVEALSGFLYRVELPNGHRLLAYARGRAAADAAGLPPGARLKLAVSPFDLSRARIIGTLAGKEL